MWHKLSRKSMFIASYILYCRDTRLDVYGFSGDQIQCMDSRFGRYNTKKSVVDPYLILVAMKTFAKIDYYSWNCS